MALGLLHVALGAISPSTLLSPDKLLAEFGSVALFVAAGIIFAECGLLVGFFLPGDSLLFVVGLFVGNGTIKHGIVPVLILLILAAIVGNVVGYFVGKHLGPALFSKPDARLFKHSYLEATEAFFEKHGGKAIILGRFVPIVRTFITVTAGASLMDFRRYLLFSTIGAIVWAGGITLLGYFFGNIPWIKSNLEVAIILIIVVSITPPLISHVRRRLHNRRAASS